ncbi:MAG: SpoIIE family protein phosphatase [Candidatus Riflebacteria bacterium]|nr:SpoIIE family protein phosphatase [Candidatus Riflebacteria bacterium]
MNFDFSEIKKRVLWFFSILVFFALPTLLAILGVKTRLDEIEKFSQEKIFSVQEQILLRLRKREETHLYFKHLFENLVELMSPDGANSRLILGIKDLKRRFPGLCSIYVVDKNGDIINDVSEPNSPKYILKVFFLNYLKQFLHQPNSLAKAWPHIQPFIGQDITLEKLGENWKEIIEVNPGLKNHWFFSSISCNGGFFVHVNECPEWSDIGIMDRVGSYIARMGDRKKGVPFFQIGITAPGGILPSPPISFALLKHQKNSDTSFVFENCQVFLTRLKSSSFLWIAFQRDSKSKTRFLRLLAVAFGTLLFAFLTWVSARIHFGDEKFFFSIKWRLVSLFFYASLLPLLVIFTFGWDYLGKEYNAQMAENLEKTEKTLRSIDLHFPYVRLNLQKKINEILNSMEYTTDQQKRETLEKLTLLGKRFKATTLVLYDKEGKSEFCYWKEGMANPLDKGGKVLGELIQSAIPFLNHETSDLKTDFKADIFQTLGGINLIAVLAKGLGKLEEYQFTQKRGWIYFKAFHNSEKKVTHILSLFWRRDDLEEEYLVQQILGKKKSFGKCEVIALGTNRKWNISRIPSLTTVAYAFSPWIEIMGTTINKKFFESSKTIFLTGIKPKELKTCSLLAIQNDLLVRSRINRIRQFLLGFAGICVFISLFLGMILSQKLLKPIDNLSKGIQSIQRKEFRFLLPLLEFDELGKLTEMFNHMTESLYEISVAQMVQQQLFPGQPLKLGEYTIFGRSRSASELGGDYFDYLQIDERYLLILIGDVTGHGVPAALVMAMARGIVQERLFSGTQLSDTISILNTAMFRDLNRKLFMTAGFIFIDSQSNEGVFFNCGHPFPFIISPGGNLRMLQGRGVALGMREKSRLTPINFIFQPGERIIMYTDGLVETLTEVHGKTNFDLLGDYLLTRPIIQTELACDDYLNNHPHILGGKPQPDDFTIVIVDRVALPKKPSTL